MHFHFWSNRIEHLAIFASRVTGNPHAFDAGTISGNLLYRLIQRMNKDRQIVLPENKVFPSLQRHRCLFFCWTDVRSGVQLHDVLWDFCEKKRRHSTRGD